jgi:hypothetical protein
MRLVGHAALNKYMHPTRDTLPIIKRNRASGRVMRGVRRAVLVELNGRAIY